MAEVFLPDNVTMLESAGTTYNMRPEYGEPIVGDIMDNALIMQLAQYKEMNGKRELSFDILDEGLNAYLVDEGERIGTTRAKWKEVVMSSQKIATIVPVSREHLYYKQPQFFEFYKPLIAEALYKKIDRLTILGKDKPKSLDWTSISEAAETAGHVVSGDLNTENYDKTIDLLNDKGYEPNAYITLTKNNSKLRDLIRFDGNNVASRIYQRGTNYDTLDGIPAFKLNRRVALDVPKGTLFAGDFDKVYYGIPYNMTYAISNDATLTTIQDDEGNPVNLFERELTAMRVTFDFAYLLVDNDAFAKIEPADATEGDEGGEKPGV